MWKHVHAVNKVSWIEENLGIELRDWQRDIISDTNQHRIVDASRRSGRTMAMALDAGYTAAILGEDVDILVPTRIHGANVLRIIYPLYGRYIHHHTNGGSGIYLRCGSGGSISIMVPTHTSLLGRQVHNVYMDTMDEGTRRCISDWLAPQQVESTWINEGE